MRFFVVKRDSDRGKSKGAQCRVVDAATAADAMARLRADFPGAPLALLSVKPAAPGRDVEPLYRHIPNYERPA